MVAVLLAWALFYFQDLAQLGGFFGKLFTFRETSVQGINLILGFLPVMLVAIFAATPAAKKMAAKMENNVFYRYGRILAAAVLLILCAASLASSSFNPFIYFQF